MSIEHDPRRSPAGTPVNSLNEIGASEITGDPDGLNLGLTGRRRRPTEGR